jgi:hypothetical protein
MAKRNVAPGTAVFEHDIADVTGMAFPLVPIGKEDGVLCIFRQRWRFGLFFDFNPRRDFSIPDMQRDLGTLYRRLKYRDLYAIADQTVFSRLVMAHSGRGAPLGGRRDRGSGRRHDLWFRWQIGSTRFFLLSAVDLEMLVFVLVLARVVDRKSRNFKQLCANIHYLGRNGMDEIRMVGFPS